MFRRALFGAALLAASSAWGADSAMDRATLRDVKAFKVVIDPVQPELQKEGFAVNDLSARIQKRLQAAGLAVDPDANEFLGFTMKSMRARKAPLALMFQLSFYQVVDLTRDANIKTVTETWSVQDALFAQPKLAGQLARTALDNLVDQFIAAWQSQNRR